MRKATAPPVAVEPLAPDEPSIESRLKSPVWLILALGLGVFFAGFDQTFVVTILPNMMDDLGIRVDNFGRAAWIVNGYLLGYTIALPLMGRIADVFGHVRVYAAAIGIFVLGSALVATAPTLEILTIGRVVQAIGGGALVPISMAIAADVLPVGRRALAVGAIAALDDTSSLLGPLYAAILVEPLGWRGLFWIGIPLQLPFLFLVWWLAKDRKLSNRGTVDWLGGLLLAAGLSALTLGLTDPGGQRPTWQTFGFFALAVGCSVAFVWRQLRIPFPLVQLRILAKRTVSAPIALYFIDGAATITALICIPLMTNVLWDGSPLDGGLNLMKLLLWMPVGGFVGGIVSQRIGYRPVAAAAFSLTGISFLLMWQWATPPSQPAMWGTLFLFGMGIGLNDAPVIGSILDSVRAMERATAAALSQAAQTVGMIVGTALLATQGLGRFDERAADLFEQEGVDATTEQYQALMARTFDEIFVVAAIVSLATIGLTFFLASGRARTAVWSPLAGLVGRVVDGDRPADRPG